MNRATLKARAQARAERQARFRRIMADLRAERAPLRVKPVTRRSWTLAYLAGFATACAIIAAVTLAR